MRHILLALIRGYQKYLSPHKGFCCAYRQHTGRGSCSALGYRAVRRFGVFGGLALIRRRTYLCGVAHRRNTPRRMPAYPLQRGSCDADCDFPGGGGLLKVCNLASFCDCGSCDWSDPKRKPSKKEKAVYIPMKKAVLNRFQVSNVPPAQ